MPTELTEAKLQGSGGCNGSAVNPNPTVSGVLCLYTQAKSAGTEFAAEPAGDISNGHEGASKFGALLIFIITTAPAMAYGSWAVKG